MAKSLIIIGAGGHGKVIADVGFKMGYTNIAFIDDNPVSDTCLNFPVIGTTDSINNLNNDETDFFIAIGNNVTREKIAKKFDVNWATLIHPSVQIGLGTEIGAGTAIMAGAVISPGAYIGKHCIINSAAVVEHDNILNDFVQLSPNVALGGSVTVGARTNIGIGTAVINNINICPDCVIGAGATVIRDIIKSGTYIGTPAIKLMRT